jgi:sugar lactone lactonase YvrE
MIRLPVFDCVVDARASVGEGAIWSSKQQRLLWLDIPAGQINRYDPASHQNEAWTVGRPIGCLAETEDNGIIGALTDGFHKLYLGTNVEQFIAGPKPTLWGHRFNDGSVDMVGRFYAGTMPLSGASERDASGTLYRLDSTGSHQVMSGFHVINGLAFGPDGKIAYVSDSFAKVRLIWAYDYDQDAALWSNRRVFFNTRSVAGRPDGGTVDADGCYWMAGVGGWQIYRIQPNGKVDLTLDVPVEKPTRIAFGGADLKTLFFTSIHVEDEPAQPQSGGVFATHISGVQGVAHPRVSQLP